MNQKIIFSTDSLARGGKERQMAVLASNLLRNNFDLFFLTKRTDEGCSYFKEYNISTELVYKYERISEYRKIVKRLKPDMVVSWDITSSFYNLLLHRNHRFYFINGSVRHGIRRLKFSHIFRSIITWLSPYIIANSLAGLRANNLKPGKRRFVLYNGTEAKFLINLTTEEVEVLKERIIPGYNEKPGFVYISVASFVPCKDYFTVLKALARLKEKIMFYYLILGDGPMRDEIEKAIADAGLIERVILVGKIENVKDYLFASDMMIHSSRGEGISNAILEGMYAGLPVIATNVGGIPETVFPGSSMLFPYKDHEALYHCLLNSRELKASYDFKSNEYQNHLSKFSVEEMVKRFEQIIDIAKGDH